MTTTEIPHISPDTSDDSLQEALAVPEWFDQLGETLTSEQLLLAMKHAKELDEWVARRLPEQYHRYALGLEPSPGLTRTLTKKLKDLEHYSLGQRS